MRYPGGKSKAVTFSYDDGVEQDKRLSDIFTKYGMKGTFNLCQPKFTKEEAEQYFFSRGHEIATHGALHRASGNVRAIDGIRDVLDCRLALEEGYDRIIRGMAYPDTGITIMGNFVGYERIKSYLTDLDIAYARTLGGDNDSFALPEDFHAWLPTAHHKNPDLPGYIDKFLALDLSTNLYHARRQSRLLYIWGHSYEFDRDGNWDLIETICRRLSGNDEIWYATNMEICEYVEAYKRLVYSADGTKVYNPTLITVWVDFGGDVYSIAPGETVRIDIKK